MTTASTRRWSSPVLMVTVSGGDGMVAENARRARWHRNWDRHAKILTGIELSREMLAIARRRADVLNRHVEFRIGDSETLDFPGASFDTVVCTFSLCAIPDHRKALAEMTRVLRPGGCFCLLIM